MAEFILRADDEAAMNSAFQALGFWREATEQSPAGPILQGPIPGDPDPMASFFMVLVPQVWMPTCETIKDAFDNDVPNIAQQHGYFARLRINGLNPFKAGGPLTIPPGLIVYWLETPQDGEAYWTADGVTPAPDFIAGIGVIA